MYMDNKDKAARSILKDNLLRLNKQQLKLFYGMLVHAWASQKAFISTRSFFNLWCELNYLCSIVDSGFPDPYDDHELLKSFCHAHPYYFIDRLSSEIIVDLFCEYIDDRLDVLATIAQKLDTEGLRAAYEYSNETLRLTDNLDESIAQAEAHVKAYS
jgi:hypothetical protein